MTTKIKNWLTVTAMAVTISNASCTLDEYNPSISYALAFLKPALVCWLPTIRAHLFCLLQVLTKQLKRASMLVR